MFDKSSVPPLLHPSARKTGTLWGPRLRGSVVFAAYPGLTHPSKPKSGLPGTPLRPGLNNFAPAALDTRGP
jgi:hypothetical protein